MEGIKIAREYMEDNNLKMVVYNNGEIIVESADRGIKPVYDVYTKDLESLRGAFVSDRVTGKAAAMLLAKGNIQGIYTELISEPAVEILNQKGIKLEYGKKVAHILNRDKNDMCPIENISRSVDSVDELLQGIEDFFLIIGMR